MINIGHSRTTTVQYLTNLVNSPISHCRYTLNSRTVLEGSNLYKVAIIGRTEQHTEERQIRPASQLLYQ
ncbi:hypothetical protein ACH3XW_0290 [Acanthocheilonema viteae]